MRAASEFWLHGEPAYFYQAMKQTKKTLDSMMDYLGRIYESEPRKE